MSAVLIVMVIVGALSGAAIGFFRKFSKTSYWGIAALLTLALVKAVGSGISKESDGYGVSLIVTAVVVIVLLTLLFEAFKQFVTRVVNSKKKYSHYKNYDDVEENEALILNAVDSGDKREYKRQLKQRKKIKESAGAWDWIDRIIGAVNGLFNALTGMAVFVIILLMFADLSQIEFMQTLFSGCLTSGSWTGIGSRIALDLPLIAALSMSIRLGYKSGISSVISLVVVLGLLIGFGFAAWSIASSEACAGAVESLKQGLLSSVADTLGATADLIAKIILTAIIFALSLIIVILVGIFLPKVMEKFAENKIFAMVDGVLGAAVACSVVTVLLVVVGGVASALSDLDFMANFNVYADLSCFGDAIYRLNPMAEAFVSVKDMFVPKQ